mgnify:CR=1 FL=1
MAFDEYLAERIRINLKEKSTDSSELKMMGGLCFMVDEKMCFGIVKDTMMARIGEAAYEEAIAIEGCSEMNFTGRKMKGYVFLSPDAIDLESDLKYWIDLCLAFNPFAKASKRKTKKN